MDNWTDRFKNHFSVLYQDFLTCKLHPALDQLVIVSHCTEPHIFK